MPRQPKYLRIQSAEQNDGLQFGEVNCRNCDYHWYPDASKWRNISFSNGDKILFCPACAVRNKIDAVKLKQIIKRTAAIKRLRKNGW